MQCNYTEGGQRNCSEHADLIVPCDIYAPTGESGTHSIGMTTKFKRNFRNLYPDDLIYFD